MSVSPEWEINAASTAVLHRSGLSVLRTGGTFFIEIRGLARLRGTKWERRANVLVEQGLVILARRDFAQENFS